MLDEINVYSRNLKFVSLAFIAYWVLQLKPKDGVIHLPLNDFEIMNPQYLPFFSYGILLYCAARFYQSSRGEFTSKFREFDDYIPKTKIMRWSWTANNLYKFCTNHYNVIYKASMDRVRQQDARAYGLGELKDDYELTVTQINYLTAIKTIRIYYTALYINSPKNVRSGNEQRQVDLKPSDNKSLYFVLVLKKLKSFLLKSEGFSDYVLPWGLFVTAGGLSIYNDFFIPSLPKLQTLVQITHEIVLGWFGS